MLACSQVRFEKAASEAATAAESTIKDLENRLAAAEAELATASARSEAATSNAAELGASNATLVSKASGRTSAPTGAASTQFSS